MELKVKSIGRAAETFNPMLEELSMANNDEKDLGGYAEQVKQQVSSAAAQVRQQAQQVVGAVQERGGSLLKAQQQQVALRVTGVAGALRRGIRDLDEQGQSLSGQYLEQAAAGLERFAQRLAEQDMASLARQTESFIRRQPGLVLGGAVLAGFLLARFLKSSAPPRAERYVPARPRPAYPDPVTGAPHRAATPPRAQASSVASAVGRPAFVYSADPVTGAPGAIESEAHAESVVAQTPRPPPLRTADPLTGAPDAIPPLEGERR